MDATAIFYFVTIFSILVSLGISAFVSLSALKAACSIATSQHEAGAKYSTAMLKLAEDISKNIDEKVASRIRVFNAKEQDLYTVATSQKPIEGAPLPPLRETKRIDDAHEIQRELSRLRNEFSDVYPKRDLGIGFDEV